MKYFSTTLFLIVFGYMTNSYSAVNVTFNLDISAQIQLGNFDPVNDSLFVRGDWQILAGDSVDWAGNHWLLTPGITWDSTYSITVQFPDNAVSTQITYKFVLVNAEHPNGSGNGGLWESIPNRLYTITNDPDQNIPLTFFDNVYLVNMTFIADMAELFNEGFSLTTDQIEVVGDTAPLSWTVPGTVLVQDINNPDYFSVSLSFVGSPGSEIQWKFHCDPENNFTQGGWESGANRILNFPYSDTTIGPILPRIQVATPSTGNNTVYFRVDMNNARERFNNNLITGLQSVWIAGNSLPLQWPSTWTFADTANGTFLKMYDDGTHSDSIAGDEIYSNIMIFNSGTPIYVPFKYAAVFDGVDTLNGGSIYLDNESGYDQNHTLLLNLNGGNVYRTNTFGDQFIPVELTGFTAVQNGTEILLNWVTATEINNQGFEVQRSGGGSDFVNVGYVEGNGTTSETNRYSFVDSSPLTGKSYYRIKQLDYDGKFEFSKIIEFDFISPGTYKLEQNFPNPFNPSTTIKYQVIENGLVTLRIFDMLGREVTTLVNENITPGSYSVNFNASGLTSGVYIYQLRAGNYVSTHKMVLLK